MNIPNKLFFFSVGYVEEAMNGSLPVSANRREFSSNEEALYAFGKDLWESLEELRLSHNEEVLERKERGFNECCLETISGARKKNLHFLCGKCWTPCILDEKRTPNFAVTDYIKKLIGLTNDQAGYDLWEEMANRGWEIGSAHFHYGKYELLIVENYQWHPNFDKFGLLGTEWISSIVEIPDDGNNWKQCPIPEENLEYEDMCDEDITFAYSKLLSKEEEENKKEEKEQEDNK